MIALDARVAPVERLVFSADGSRLAAYGSGSVEVWLGLPEPVAVGPVKIGSGSVERWAFAPDGSRLFWHVVGRAKDRNWVLHLPGGEPSRLAGVPDASTWFALDPPPGFVIASTDQGLCRYDFDAAGTPRQAWLRPRRSQVTVPIVAYGGGVCRGGARFVGVRYLRPEANPRHRLVGLRTADGRTEFTAPFEVDPVEHPPVVAPAGDVLAVPHGLTFDVRPLPPRGEPRTVRHPSRKKFTALAFHPSGRYLAAASTDGTVRLYDTATWQAAKTYKWGLGKLRSVAFSPDGLLAAAGGDQGGIIVWDLDV